MTRRIEERKEEEHRRREEEEEEEEARRGKGKLARPKPFFNFINSGSPHLEKIRPMAS